MWLRARQVETREEEKDMVCVRQGDTELPGQDSCEKVI